MILRILISFFIVLGLSACTNHFDYKPSNWTQVTETTKDKHKVVFVDGNRVVCEDNKCRAWTKLEFANEEPIEFKGSKPGTVSGYLMVKKVESSIEFNCKGRTSTLVSYKLYDRSNKVLDYKWVDGEAEYARAGTVNYELLEHICNNFNSKKQKNKSLQW